MTSPAKFGLVEADAAAIIEAVSEGATSLDAGRYVPYEDVRLWLLSWGTESELQRPECP